MISFIDSTGHERFMGNLVPAAAPSGWPVYGDTPNTPMVPREEWERHCVPAFRDNPLLPYIHDQDGIGQCFPPGTLIRMGDGSQKPIEEVRVLDEVLTAEGRVRRVTRTMVRHADEVVRVQAWGIRHLRCTHEHPILTQRGYVPAGKLTRDDWVSMPRFAPATKTMIMPREYLADGCRFYTARSKATRRVHAGIPGKAASVVTRHNPPDVIQLTPAFGRIIGLFLAEGSTSHGKVTWSFSLQEEHTHAADVVRLVAEVFGAEAKSRAVAARNVTIVTLHGTNWAKLFETWCAKGAAGKRLHPDLASGPLDFLAAVLKGWTDGDGLGPNHNGGVTVSHSLAVGMFDIANALGYRPTIETLDVKTYGSVKTRQKRYLVRWGKNLDRPEDARCRQDATHMWRRVDGVVREDYSGWVHNFEVEDDHSYVAEGVGVHNCNADATAALQEYCRNVAGLAPVRLCAADLYHRINGGSDRGSLLEDAIREMMARGIGTVEACGGTNLWKRPFTPAPDSVRARFRVLEAWLCPTYGHVMSAVIRGFGIVTGIMWPNANLDPDGWLPLGPQGGGHALFGHTPVCRRTSRGLQFGVEHNNSWTPEWERFGGRLVIGEEHYRGAIGGWWAARVVTTEGGDVPAPAN